MQAPPPGGKCNGAREDRGNCAESETASVRRHCNHRPSAAGTGPIDRDRGDRTGATRACTLRSFLVGDRDVRSQASCLACAAEHRDASRVDLAPRAAQAPEARVHLCVPAPSHSLHALADLGHGCRGRHIPPHRVPSVAALAGDTAWHRCRGVPPAWGPPRATTRARLVRGCHHRVFRTHPPPEGHGCIRRRNA